MSPYDSYDLTEVVEAREGAFIVLRSPPTAEYAPDYEVVATFATQAEADAFLTGADNSSI